MFKILYILFFIVSIMFIQYVLQKLEAFNIQNQNKHSAVTDSCSDFNYLVDNYDKCCSSSKKLIGCRRPLCENAHDKYNDQDSKNTKKKKIMIL